MDDLYAELVKFLPALTQFNEKLASSMQALEAEYERVNPHWQDEMRRKHDTQWKPLEESMQNYLNHDASAYVDFLEQQIRDLKEYFGD